MATVYVSSTGSDAYTYVQAQSSATPWLTLGKCNTSATTGDTIIVMAGSLTCASVTFTKSFTIQGATSVSSLYILTAGGGACQYNSTTAGVSITFRYLTITNMVVAGNNNLFQWGEATNTTTITVENCIINTITLGASSAIIGSSPSSGYCGNVTFKNNLVYGITSSGSARFLRIESLSTSRTINITGNTFYLNPTHIPTFINNGSPSTIIFTIKNNIIYATSAIAFGTTTYITYSYNDAYQITSPPSGTGNITSDPLFVDYANVNYNLRPSSPCIDTGGV